MKDFLVKSRKNAKLTQRDVSKKIDLTSPQFISNWERGISMPSLSELKRLAIIYGVTLAEMKHEYYLANLRKYEQKLSKKLEKIK